MRYLCTEHYNYGNSFSLYYDGYTLSYDSYLSLFSKYFPFLLNSVFYNNVCFFLLSFLSNSFFFFFNIFVLFFRNYYESDIVSRRTSYFYLGYDFNKSEYNNYF